MKSRQYCIAQEGHQEERRYLARALAGLNLRKAPDVYIRS
jgi:hypothetical protein